MSRHYCYYPSSFSSISVIIMRELYAPLTDFARGEISVVSNTIIVIGIFFPRCTAMGEKSKIKIIRYLPVFRRCLKNY